jgi:hypothetical protein
MYLCHSPREFSTKTTASLITPNRLTVGGYQVLTKPPYESQVSHPATRTAGRPRSRAYLAIGAILSRRLAMDVSAAESRRFVEHLAAVKHSAKDVRHLGIAVGRQF